MQTVRPWLGEKILTGSIRSGDVNDGCISPCDTCVYDSRFPTRRWSLNSVKEAFSNQSFINLLQPDSFRLGNTAEPTDHPQIVAIAETVLQGTEGLDYRRMAEGQGHHQVKLIISYRPTKEPIIEALIELCRKQPDRFMVLMALPRNRDSRVREAFEEMAARHWLFKGRTDFKHKGLTNLPNFLINDVGKRTDDFMLYGRVLKEEKEIPEATVTHKSEKTIVQRGLAKIHLNPWGLWLKIYSSYESYTGAIFIQVTNNTIRNFACFPWHYDFPTPPNWPGGAADTNKFTDARRYIQSVQKASSPQLVYS